MKTDRYRKILYWFIFMWIGWLIAFSYESAFFVAMFCVIGVILLIFVMNDFFS